MFTRQSSLEPNSRAFLLSRHHHIYLFDYSILFPYSYTPVNKFNRASISSEFDYQYSDIPMQEKLRIAANWITLVAPCLPLRTESIEEV